MAKKSEMHDEIVLLFRNNAVIFLEADIKTETFYRWLESFKTHTQMKTIYNFMRRLRPVVEKSMTLWSALQIDRTGWAQLKMISKNAIYVQNMKASLLDFKTMWLRKPSRRRGSE